MLSCFQGFWILAMAMTVYFWGLYNGYDTNEVRALTFITLISANIFTILTNRSWTQSIFKILRTPNPTVKWVVGGAVLFLVLVLNVPFLANMFQFSRVTFEEVTCVRAPCLPIPIHQAPVSLEEAVCASALGALSIVWFEVHKFFKAR